MGLRVLVFGHQNFQKTYPLIELSCRPLLWSFCRNLLWQSHFRNLECGELKIGPNTEYTCDLYQFNSPHCISIIEFRETYILQMNCLRVTVPIARIMEVVELEVAT